MFNNQSSKYLAVVVTGLVAFACSIVWYSPMLFGSIWMESRGAAVASSPAWKFMIMPLREIITACLLAWLIGRLAITGWRQAAALGFVLWLAFYAVQLAGAVIWDDMPWALGAVHAGDWLMKMLLMSVMLSLWLGPKAGRVEPGPQGAGGVSRTDAGTEARDIAEAVARRSYGKLVAFLAMRTGDVAAAEDALAEAFATALSSWPKNGCPSNPEAWLLTVARRRMVDLVRNTQRRKSAVNDLKLLSDGLAEAASEQKLPDQRLALMFAAAHPAIEERIRAPLILQVVLGLSAETIASTFLTAPATMGKRLVRAKEKIKHAGIPFSIPERALLPARLDAVLDAIYAAFGAGWEDPIGADAMRGELTAEALYLARLVVELMPTEPEAMGLAALMLHSHARRAARRDAYGDYVPFAEQDTSEWDQDMIGTAEGLLVRAGALVADGRASIGRYQLEAAVQSAHVHRHLTGRFNWPEIVHLYDALASLTGSPVVAINRALAIAEIGGADAGLKALPEPGAEGRLADYQPYWAARADLLARTGMHPEARHAYDIAIGLERDEAVRRFLQRRQAEMPE